jgi:hypothetical protein
MIINKHLRKTNFAYNFLDNNKIVAGGGLVWGNSLPIN